MQTVWRSLRPGGVFLLSLPVGPDLIVWNLHRRYGTLRLPRMLAGWEELRRVGWMAGRLHAPADHRHRYEPVFVLRRNSSEPEQAYRLDDRPDDRLRVGDEPEEDRKEEL